MLAAGAWARAKGARFAYVQVAATNAASLTLNAGLWLNKRDREHGLHCILLTGARRELPAAAEA